MKVLFQDFIKKSTCCFFSEPFHGKISIKASHCSLLVLSQPNCSCWHKQTWQRNNLVKLWKNWLPLVVLNQRRQAKVQYEKMLEELVPKYREEFANFDIFANYVTFVCKEVRYWYFVWVTGSLLWNVALGRIRNIQKRTSPRSALFLSELFTIIWHRKKLLLAVLP